LFRTKPVQLLVVPIALAALLGCANRSTSTSSTSSSTSSSSTAAPAAPANTASDPAQAASTKPIPKGHAFEKVKYDMTDAQVKQVLGAPTTTRAYPSAKTFMPYYFGTEGSREGWIYKGKGQVTFSRNKYNGALTVIEVIYDPAIQ
jgi:hypothetical protein